MEAIVSVLLFAILVATVTMFLQLSMRMSAGALQLAETVQENHRQILEGSGTAQAEIIVINSPYFDAIELEINVYEHEGFVSFEPR